MHTSREPAMIALRAGDRVLVLLNDDPPAAELEEIMDALHGSFEGVEFVGLSNVAGVLVQPTEPKTRRPSTMWADADTPTPPEAA